MKQDTNSSVRSELGFFSCVCAIYSIIRPCRNLGHFVWVRMQTPNPNSLVGRESGRFPAFLLCIHPFICDENSGRLARGKETAAVRAAPPNPINGLFDLSEDAPLVEYI